jgi:hypothetical protein
MQISLCNQEIAPKIIEPFNPFHPPKGPKKKEKEKKNGIFFVCQNQRVCNNRV